MENWTSQEMTVLNAAYKIMESSLVNLNELLDMGIDYIEYRGMSMERSRKGAVPVERGTFEWEDRYIAKIDQEWEEPKNTFDTRMMFYRIGEWTLGFYK